MKKIIATVMFAVASLAQAATPVQVIWPFAPGSNQANAMRVLIKNANEDQNKYEFTFDTKPGAGGAIAGNHVINSTGDVLLMHSTSVFTRPYYYPDQAYDLNKLTPVVVLAKDSPLVLLSVKYGSVADLKGKTNVNAGANLGSVTEFIVRGVEKSVAPTKMTVVPYTNTIQSTTDVVAGNLDTGVEFIKDSLQWVTTGKAKIIGITGTKSVNGHKTFKEQGVEGLDHAVGNFYVLAGPNMPTDKVQEFYAILNKAQQKQNVKDVWSQDFATVPAFTYDQTKQFWSEQKAKWTK